MINPLPLLALGAVALGYAGAVGRDGPGFDATDTPPALSAFPAATVASPLSVHEVMRRSGDALAANEAHCDAAPVIAATLSHDFEESRRDAWTQAGDMRMELWASELMGTWTLVHMGEDGISCIVSSGLGWQDGTTTAEILTLSPLAS